MRAVRLVKSREEEDPTKQKAQLQVPPAGGDPDTWNCKMAAAGASAQRQHCSFLGPNFASRKAFRGPSVRYTNEETETKRRAFLRLQFVCVGTQFSVSHLDSFLL